MERRDPFECWYTLADAAARLGVSRRTIVRLVETAPALMEAARVVCGEVRIPWSAWQAWLSQKPAAVFQVRTVRLRDARGFFVSEPVRGRTEGEVRRKLEEHGVAHE